MHLDMRVLKRLLKFRTSNQRTKPCCWFKNTLFSHFSSRCSHIKEIMLKIAYNFTTFGGNGYWWGGTGSCQGLGKRNQRDILRAEIEHCTHLLGTVKKVTNMKLPPQNFRRGHKNGDKTRISPSVDWASSSYSKFTCPYTIKFISYPNPPKCHLSQAQSGSAMACS